MESRVSPQAPGAHLPDHPDFLWRNPEPKRSYDVVIIGGGGHGLATAHYLVKNHGITNVAVLEKGWLAGGNMARNTTLIRSNYLWDESTAIYEHSLKLWEGLEDDLGYPILFSQRGVLNLAHSLQDVRDSVRRVEANVLNGVDAKVSGNIVDGYNERSAEPNALAFAAVCLASFVKDFAMGASWSTTIDIGHRYSGTVAGFMNTVGNLGTVVSPPLVMWLVLATGEGDAHKLSVSLYYYATMFFIASVCWLFINPRQVIVYAPSDRQRLQAEGALD